MVVPSEDITLQHAIDLFREAYGSDPDIAAYAPGRVNLIGTRRKIVKGGSVKGDLWLQTFRKARASGGASWYRVDGRLFDSHSSPPERSLFNPLHS
jgi:hypothetical protein